MKLILSGSLIFFQGIETVWTSLTSSILKNEKKSTFQALSCAHIVTTSRTLALTLILSDLEVRNIEGFSNILSSVDFDLKIDILGSFVYEYLGLPNDCCKKFGIHSLYIETILKNEARKWNGLIFNQLTIFIENESI